MKYKLYTTAERPNLVTSGDEIVVANWPEFMLHDEVANEYFLKPRSSANSLKQCLHKWILYCPTCAPYLPQFSHFVAATPNFLSLGLLCFKNFLSFAGFFLNCFVIFLQSLAVICSLPSLDAFAFLRYWF